jgi:hypothetical protein
VEGWTADIELHNDLLGRRNRHISSYQIQMRIDRSNRLIASNTDELGGGPTCLGLDEETGISHCIEYR